MTQFGDFDRHGLDGGPGIGPVCDGRGACTALPPPSWHLRANRPAMEGQVSVPTALTPMMMRVQRAISRSLIAKICFLAPSAR
jgi:hypothetical protein